MDVLLSIERIRRWGFMGGMAILDQGVFSGSNFILNILLARWLTPDDFGAYAMGLAVTMFFLQLLMSYILEPMGVLGPSSYGDHLKDYLTAQVRLYFITLTPLSFALLSMAYLFRLYGGDPLFCNILMAVGGMLSLLLLPWMLRRVFYILRRPDISAIGSAAYAVLVIAFLYLAKHFIILTGLSSIFIVALSGLISGALLMIILNWDVKIKVLIHARSVFLGNWAFGKWLLASGLLVTLGGQAQVFLAGSLLSIKDAGVVNATQTFSNPMIVSITAISALITPTLAADFAKADFASFKQKAFSMTLMLTILASVFELALVLFKVPLEAIFYEGKFSSHVELIPIWGLAPLLMAIVSGMQSSLQAAKRPYAILLASLVWVPVTLGLGTIMTLSWGLWGIALSTVIGYLVLALSLSFLYWRWVIPSSDFEVVQGSR